MKKILKKTGYIFLSLLAILFLAAVALAYIPLKPKSNHKGITPGEAAERRANFTGPHHLLTTTDGETLFLRRWDPPVADSTKQSIAVLIFHGITAHSGPYKMAAEPVCRKFLC